MAATLVQETGTGASNANTYLTLAEYETFLSDRGLTDTTSNEAKTGRIILAMDWLENQEKRYQGEKFTDAQALVWPRSWVTIYSYALGADTIPQQLKDAQAQLVYDSAENDLYNVNDGRVVKREKVDAIEVEYGNKASNIQPIFAKVEAILKPLFKSTGGFGSVIRA